VTYRFTYFYLGGRDHVTDDVTTPFFKNQILRQHATYAAKSIELILNVAVIYLLTYRLGGRDHVTDDVTTIFKIKFYVNTPHTFQRS